MAKCR